MTKTDPAPMAPPLRAEEEEEEEEDEPVQEPPSPTQERRQKPVVHPSAPAPLPKDYAFTFFDPNDPPARRFCLTRRPPSRSCLPLCASGYRRSSTRSTSLAMRFCGEAAM